MCCKRKKLNYSEYRRFIVSTDRDKYMAENGQFPSNFIKTSHYNLIDFLPLSIMKQFMRYANVYFLWIAVISSIKEISPLNPLTSVLPLLFVIFVSITREGFEDYYRHVSDNQLNATEATVIENGQEKQLQWKDIQVGDILKVYQDKPFPADLILLGSAIKSGNCYIETGALDGEKNLKPKNCIQETISHFQDNNFSKNLKIQIGAEKPNMDLYSFEGSLEFLEGDETQKKTLLLNAKSMLLRGAFLRNTEWVFGVVVYTGLDTKIMKNAEPSKVKFSDMELMMNQFITFIFFFQILLCVAGALLTLWWGYYYGKQHWYIEDTNSASYNAMLRFFTYFILFNTMIPISLIVSLEIVKVVQAYFISNDQEMYVAAKDKYPVVQTASINEELGQVEYIFSDKTGTLTCNVMQFKMSVIGDELYGKEESDRLEKAIKNEAETNKVVLAKPDEQLELTKFVFKDQKLVNLLKNKENDYPIAIQLQSDDKKSSFSILSQYDLVCEYFTLLASAHECLVQWKKNVDKSDLANAIYYGGPSPDEITLVDAAKNMGFIFTGSTGQDIQLNILGQTKSVKLLNSFEFDSARKRMSVIVQDGNVYKMYVKGADNIIKQRLGPNQPFLAQTNDLLTQFSLVGLRTLLMAMKILSEAEYQDFKNKYNSLAESDNREQDIKNLADTIENDFYLIGATAVEDKLQDQVPETIYDLIRANIKVWMLTGDKLETAENIARSCKLIQNDMQTMKIQSSKDVNEISNQLKIEALNIFKKCIAEKQRKSFLIEGEALAVVLNDEDLKKTFVEITKDCESVVCCRVTPKQKAEVVRTIKEGLNKITLAIGDGANDVNMIQEAQIGCGIYGNEGMRAVQSSDFAFGEFKCLWRLVLIHGRWNYIRNAEMILYFFYKNMIFTLPQAFFAYFNAYSGQTIFEDSYLALYNLLFTALPLMARAIMEQDVNYRVEMHKKNKIYNQKTIEDEILLREDYAKKLQPTLYRIGQQKTLFSKPIFFAHQLQGLLHSAIIFAVNYFAMDSFFQRKTFHQNGYASDLWVFSLTIYTSIILVADFKISLTTRYWTIFYIIALFITSIGAYIGYFTYSNVSPTNVANAPFILVKTFNFYLTMVIAVGIIFVFDLLLFFINNVFYRDKGQKLRKLMKQAGEEDEQKQQHSDSNSLVQSFNNYKQQHVLPKSANNLMQNYGSEDQGSIAQKDVALKQFQQEKVTPLNKKMAVQEQFHDDIDNILKQ